MATLIMKANIPCDIHKVWGVVIDVENYTWRSDINKTEVLNEKQFIEYTKDGFSTLFTTTAIESYKRWEFTMENDNIKGCWIGIFTSKGSETEVLFKEVVSAKKFIFKPFIKLYLKKQQNQFIADLKKALSV